jgi:phosphatidylserine decarboxylase
MSIAPQALPYAVALGLLALAGAGLWHPAAALPPMLMFLFTLWFFRDPEREVPREPDVLLSPADGRVIQAGPERISIFMNVFNVHVCRSPMAGRVESVEHRRGSFAAAYRDSASEHNERTSIRLDGAGRRVVFTLVAGLVARRIVCRLEAGQSVAAGERIGLIQFGSRVDVDLPAGASVSVALRDRVVAGETILARLRENGGSPRGIPI